MRPADKTRAPSLCDRPKNSRALLRNRQCGGEPQQNSPIRNENSGDSTVFYPRLFSQRTTILLLDADPTHGEALARALHFKYEVTLCADIRSALHLLKQQDFDLVIIASARSFDWQTPLRSIHELNLTKNNPSPVLICARVNRGPHERLRAECQGARFVYEQ